MLPGSRAVPWNLQRGLAWWRIGQSPALQQGHAAGDALNEAASTGK